MLCYNVETEGNIVWSAYIPIYLYTNFRYLGPFSISAIPSLQARPDQARWKVFPKLRHASTDLLVYIYNSDTPVVGNTQVRDINLDHWPFW